jgi:hypothetical protein
MIQLSLYVAYYMEVECTDYVTETFDKVLKIITALELILNLRHMAVGMYPCMPLGKDGKHMH